MDISKGIQKKILYPGKGPLMEFDDGTKVIFHYKTFRLKDDGDKVEIDDSKKIQKPMELLMGKKFKLDVWELCLKTMCVDEVSSFTCETWTVACYPPVMKNLRDINSNKRKMEQHHCCGIAQMQNSGLGYPDLDDLVKDPKPLEFIFEVTSIEPPGNVEKNLWAATDTEKKDVIPKLHEEGNRLYKLRDYENATRKYSDGIACLEQLMLKEKPGEQEHDDLQDLKRPLLLNFAMCKLAMKDYYPVIEHTTTVLNKEPDNVKALYRRAMAYIGTWGLRQAKEDILRVQELDQSMKQACHKELKHIADLQNQKDQEDRVTYKKMF